MTYEELRKKDFFEVFDADGIDLWIEEVTLAHGAEPEHFDDDGPLHPLTQTNRPLVERVRDALERWEEEEYHPAFTDKVAYALSEILDAIESWPYNIEIDTDAEGPNEILYLYADWNHGVPEVGILLTRESEDDGFLPEWMDVIATCWVNGEWQ